MQNQLSNFLNYKGLCKINLPYGYQSFPNSRHWNLSFCAIVCLFVCLLGLACRFARFSRFSRFSGINKANRTAFGFGKWVIVSTLLAVSELIWVVVDFRKIGKRRCLDRPQ